MKLDEWYTYASNAESWCLSTVVCQRGCSRLLAAATLWDCIERRRQVTTKAPTRIDTRHALPMHAYMITASTTPRDRDPLTARNRQSKTNQHCHYYHQCKWAAPGLAHPELSRPAASHLYGAILSGKRATDWPKITLKVIAVLVSHLLRW